MIHEARLEKGLTQEELAIKCGMTKSFRIEN
ncbi:MAG: helix-turn-helix domain-containing protein [Leadbetterella sp.]